MKIIIPAGKVKNIRISRGFSQELLAEKTGLPLRTIQKIETGEIMPDDETLSKISEALEVKPDEKSGFEKESDKGYLTLMNVSALSFIINPLFGVLAPLVFWILKKDKVEKLEEYGIMIMNFQITLIIIIILIFIVSGIMAFVVKTSMSIGLSIIFVFLSSGLYYLYNIIMTLWNVVRIQKDLPVKYMPVIKIIR